MDNNVDRHMDICKELNALYAKKNHDYGDSFHKSWLEEGFSMARVRLTDKLNRFKQLTKDENQHVMDESIRDTLIDNANYSIMTIMEMDREKIGEQAVSSETYPKKDYKITLDGNKDDEIKDDICGKAYLSGIRVDAEDIHVMTQIRCYGDNKYELTIGFDSKRNAELFISWFHSMLSKGFNMFLQDIYEVLDIPFAENMPVLRYTKSNIKELEYTSFGNAVIIDFPIVEEFEEN